MTTPFTQQAHGIIERELDLHELMVQHPAATFFVRVQGRSMELARIFDGDILVVDRALTAGDGKLVLAVLDGVFTVRRLKIDGKGKRLEAEAHGIAPIEILPTSDFQVWGVITYVIHKA